MHFGFNWDYGVDAYVQDFAESFTLESFVDEYDCPGIINDQTITPSSELLEIFHPEDAFRRPLDMPNLCDDANFAIDHGLFQQVQSQNCFEELSAGLMKKRSPEPEQDYNHGAKRIRDRSGHEFNVISRNPITNPVIVSSLARLDVDANLIRQIFDSDRRNSVVAPSAVALQAAVDYYSGNCSVSSVSVFTPLVCQKSYGKEKRFCCPAPMLQFSGLLRVASLDAEVNISVPGLPSGQQFKFTLPQSANSVIRDGSDNADTLLFKNIFLTDDMFVAASTSHERTSTGKSFQFNFQLGSLGAFQSRPVNLISKPPKKRKSSCNKVSPGEGLNCSRVALFNRVKGQTGSTRYLSVSVDRKDNGDSVRLECSSTRWEPFSILFTAKNAQTALTNGSVIRLKSSSSDWISPEFRIKIIDSSVTTNDHRSVVRNMQKVLLEYAQMPGFLGASVDTSSKVELFDTLSENCAWTLAQVDSCTYSWLNRPVTDLTLPFAAAPSPNILSCNVINSHAKTALVLRFEFPAAMEGRDASGWDIFLGNHPLVQFYESLSGECVELACEISNDLLESSGAGPLSLAETEEIGVEPFLINNNPQQSASKAREGLPLLMTRRVNGVLYDTGLSIGSINSR